MSGILKFLENYNVIVAIIALLALIWGIYNKIKFLCLEKASEMVSEAEGRTDLTGQEKFALVLSWINKDLPKVFANSLFQSVIEKLIEFAYKTSFSYMKNYVKRKTGYDISDIVNQLQEVLETDEDDDNKK